jgi:O-antigen/teichoic acid export membrane protein
VKLGALLQRNRSFAADVGWSMAHDGTTVVANLVAFLLLGRNLGDAGYGAYVGVFGIIGPLAGLAWAGVGLAALQRIVRAEHDHEQVARRMLGQGLLTGIGGTVVAIGIGALFIRTLPLLDIAALVVAELLALNVVLISAFILQGVQGVPAASRLRMVVVGIRLLIVVGLHQLDLLTVRNIGLSGVVLFTLLTIWVLTVRLPRVGISVRPGRPTSEDSRLAFSFSIPMVGSNVQLDGDKTVLNAYGMADVAGVYGAAFRVINMAMTPIRALQAAAFNRLLPHDETAIGQHTRRARRFALLNLVAVLPVCVVLFFAVDVLKPLLGDDFEESARMARWLLLFLPLKAVSDAPLGGLLGLGRPTTRAWCVLAAAGVSLALYVVLIPIWSWAGAVVGTVVGEFVLLLVGTHRLVTWQRHHDAGVDAAADPAPAEVPA